MYACTHLDIELGFENFFEKIYSQKKDFLSATDDAICALLQSEITKGNNIICQLTLFFS